MEVLIMSNLSSSEYKLAKRFWQEETQLVECGATEPALKELQRALGLSPDVEATAWCNANGGLTGMYVTVHGKIAVYANGKRGQLDWPAFFTENRCVEWEYKQPNKKHPMAKE